MELSYFLTTINVSTHSRILIFESMLSKVKCQIGELHFKTFNFVQGDMVARIERLMVLECTKTKPGNRINTMTKRFSLGNPVCNN